MRHNSTQTLPQNAKNPISSILQILQGKFPLDPRGPPLSIRIWKPLFLSPVSAPGVMQSNWDLRRERWSFQTHAFLLPDSNNFGLAKKRKVSLSLIFTRVIHCNWHCIPFPQHFMFWYQSSCFGFWNQKCHVQCQHVWQIQKKNFWHQCMQFAIRCENVM